MSSLPCGFTVAPAFHVHTLKPLVSLAPPPPPGWVRMLSLPFTGSVTKLVTAVCLPLPLNILDQSSEVARNVTGLNPAGHMPDEGAARCAPVAVNAKQMLGLPESLTALPSSWNGATDGSSTGVVPCPKATPSQRKARSGKRNHFTPRDRNSFEKLVRMGILSP